MNDKLSRIHNLKSGKSRHDFPHFTILPSLTITGLELAKMLLNNILNRLPTTMFPQISLHALRKRQPLPKTFLD